MITYHLINDDGKQKVNRATLFTTLVVRLIFALLALVLFSLGLGVDFYRVFAVGSGLFMLVGARKATVYFADKG